MSAGALAAFPPSPCGLAPASPRPSPPTACTRNQTAAIRNQDNSPSAVSMAAFGQ